VTPEREAPIIPYATTNHGDILFPIKNDWLLAFLAVIQVTTNSRTVYPIKIPSIRKGDIIAILPARITKRMQGKKFNSHEKPVIIELILSKTICYELY
jgi:NMD protein affecting ribosome stability and mRNA decay